MAASVTGAPNSNTTGIDIRLRFQKRDGPSPIGDLPPGVDIVPHGPIARPKITMIMYEYDKAGCGDGLSEALEAVLFHAGIAVSHGNGRVPLLT
jgi:hypothetical protein